MDLLCKDSELANFDYFGGFSDHGAACAASLKWTGSDSRVAIREVREKSEKLTEVSGKILINVIITY